MKLSELKDKITTILRERSTYKLGTQEYTKKNLTPTDILDLAMAYSQVKGKGTTLWGNKMEKMMIIYLSQQWQRPTSIRSASC